MDIFRGLIQSSFYRNGEEITVLFPNGIVAGERAYVHWGEESNIASMTQPDKNQVGKIIPLGRSGDNINLSFIFDENRSFQATFNQKSHALTLELVEYDSSVVLTSGLRLVSNNNPTILGFFSDTIVVKHDLDAPVNVSGVVFGCMLTDGGTTVSEQLSFALGMIFGTVGIGMALLGPGMPAVAGAFAGAGFAVTSLVLPNATSWLPWSWLLEEKKVVAKQLNLGQMIQRTGNTSSQTLTVFWVQTSSDGKGNNMLEFRKIEKNYSEDTTVSLKSLIGGFNALSGAGEVLAKLYVPDSMNLRNRSVAYYAKKNPKLERSGGYGFKSGVNAIKWKDNTVFQVSGNKYEAGGHGYDGFYKDSYESLSYEQDEDIQCGELFLKGRNNDQSNGLFDLSTANSGIQSFCQKNKCRVDARDKALQIPLKNCTDFDDLRAQIKKFVDEYGVEKVAAVSWQFDGVGQVTGYLNGDFGDVRHVSMQNSYVFLPVSKEEFYMMLS